jgi:hypothetical protein
MNFEFTVFCRCHEWEFEEILENSIRKSCHQSGVKNRGIFGNLATSQKQNPGIFGNSAASQKVKS